MTRRSGTRIGLRTGFGWISTPIEELSAGTIFLLMLSEVFRGTNRIFFGRRSRRGRSDPFVSLVMFALGVVLYPVVFTIGLIVMFGPWMTRSLVRGIGSAAAQLGHTITAFKSGYGDSTRRLPPSR